MYSEIHWVSQRIAARAKGKSEGVAGRDYISWSQLSTFRQCPLKYRFRYLDKLEPEFVASSLLIGSSIHAAIEFHHRKQLESDESATLNEMLETFWIQWKDRTEESPPVRFGKNEDVSVIGQLAERMCSTFLASELYQSPGRVIGIEESFRKVVFPKHPELLGVIDLAFVSDDHLIIRDYKTSRSKWNQGIAESSAPQLWMYAELAKDLLPGRKMRLEFAVLTKTKSPSMELFVVTPDLKRMERTKQIASRTLDAIDTGVFYPNQSAMNCGSCPYRSACRAWRG